jgi:hypothetical protein
MPPALTPVKTFPLESVTKKTFVVITHMTAGIFKVGVKIGNGIGQHVRIIPAFKKGGLHNLMLCSQDLYKGKIGIEHMPG